MIDFTEDIMRFEYASRGDEVRDSLVSMFEHVQEILHSDSAIDPYTFQQWVRKGIMDGQVIYRREITEDGNHAVNSNALRSIFMPPLKFIAAHGDSYERNGYVKKQMPGYPSVPAPTPEAAYNPPTKYITKDEPVEFEPGWFAKGRGLIMYPYDADYITCVCESTSIPLEVWTEIPIMHYPYLLNVILRLIFEVDGMFDMEARYVDENGNELDRMITHTINMVINGFRTYNMIVDLNPHGDDPDAFYHYPDWKIRVKFYQTAKNIGNSMINYQTFYIRKLYLITEDVMYRG